MASSDTPEIQQPSRLLRLPREVRDLIYDYVLVRDTIAVEAAVVKINETTATRSPGYSQNLKKMLPCYFPWVHRRLWLVPVLDIICDFGPRDRTEDPRSTRSVSMTYQLASTLTAGQVDPIELRLLQTCRQIYVEACEAFYSRNIFSFTSDLRLGTAFAFLCDRPAESLRLIRSMELALMEDNNMRGTDGAHYPMSSRSTDCMVLQFAYNHFTDLTTLISTSRMQLRRLFLNIETWTRSYEPVPETFAQCITWETARLKGSPVIASWVSPLLNIEDLESVEVFWAFNRPYFRRMANTLLLMELNMLKKGSRKPEVFDTSAKDRKVHMSMRQSHMESKPRWSNDPKPIPELDWKDYIIAADGTWEALGVDSLPLAMVGMPKTALVQGVGRDPMEDYICYCRLV